MIDDEKHLTISEKLNRVPYNVRVWCLDQRQWVRAYTDIIRPDLGPCVSAIIHEIDVDIRHGLEQAD